jgi:hypothetical protein
MQNEWIPEVGKLIVRQMLGLYCNEMQLSYRSDARNTSSIQGIAEARDFEARPKWCGWFECVDGEVGMTGSGMMVVRRFATDNDIKFFLLCWSDPKITLSEWLDQVQDTTTLLAEEKERIMRLAAEVQKRP